MELFYMGLFTGLLLGIALVTIVILIYTSRESHNDGTEHSVEEVKQWISLEERQEDCEGCEMNLEEPPIPHLSVKIVPPSSVGDAEVRHRSAVVHEDEDKE